MPAAPALELFARLGQGFASWPSETPPPWRSDVGDDHSPFEFSIAIGGAVELRVMLEPMGATPSLRSNASAGLALLAALARDGLVRLDAVERVHDSYFPNEPEGHFALWLAFELPCDRGAPRFKLYLNAEAQGVALRPAIVEETLARLGFASAWPRVATGIAARGHELDELKYVALDIDARAQHPSPATYRTRHIPADAPSPGRCPAVFRSIPGRGFRSDGTVILPRPPTGVSLADIRPAAEASMTGVTRPAPASRSAAGPSDSARRHRAAAEDASRSRRLARELRRSGASAAAARSRAPFFGGGPPPAPGADFKNRRGVPICSPGGCVSTA